MGRKPITELLKEFRNKVAKDYKVEKLILFGSRASGKPTKYSDIDLVVVSSSFRNVDSFKRVAIMYEWWDLDYPVDFLCYTPEEFNKLKKQVSLVREAAEHGVVI